MATFLQVGTDVRIPRRGLRKIALVLDWRVQNG